MEILMETEIYLMTGALFLAILWLWIKKSDNLPPGPFWRLPVLGNSIEFTKHTDIRITLRHLRLKYGEVYSLYLGPQLVVVINGLDAIREAIVKRGDEFSDRPETFVQTFRAKRRGIINSSGHCWRTMRKFSLNTLRSFGFGKRSLESQIHEEIVTLLEEIGKHGDAPFDPHYTLMTSFCNVICSIAFGTKYSHDDPELLKMLDLIERIIAILGKAGALNFLPFLRFLPGDRFRFKELQQTDIDTSEFFQRRIEECKKNYDENNISDFISAFLKEMKGDLTSSEADYFKEFDLRVLMGDLMGAGADTSSITTRWAILYLINYPEIQDRIAKEIIQNVGMSRLPCMSDRENLVFTEAFIMETQRKANLVILSLPRTVAVDTAFRGYTIPKGSVILPDFDSVLSDPRIWGDPENFRPERFIGPDGKILKPEGFIPFSIGRRNCMGEQLAKMELFLFIASLIQKFQFLAPEGQTLDIEKLDGNFGVTHSPKPYMIRVHPRY